MIDAARFQKLQAMGIPVWQRRAFAVESDQSVDAGSQAEELSAEWQRFESECSHCQRCALAQTRSHVVVGDGPRKVDLCIIGEAPGAEEDRQGKPFVGRAGQLLTQMLQAIGLSREQVYITNILKCRPPGNRDPRPEEIAECSPYLSQQLSWLQPKVLLLLGRISAQTLLETSKPMRALRGQHFTYSQAAYPTVVTYHPAYLLRNPADKAKVLEDLLRVKSLLSM